MLMEEEEEREEDGLYVVEKRGDLLPGVRLSSSTSVSLGVVRRLTVSQSYATMPT